MITILSSIVNKIEGERTWPFNEHKHLHFDIEDVNHLSSKIMRKVTTMLIWICWPSHTYRMFISSVKWSSWEKKINHSRPIYLSSPHRVMMKHMQITSLQHSVFCGENSLMNQETATKLEIISGRINRNKCHIIIFGSLRVELANSISRQQITQQWQHWSVLQALMSLLR